MPRSVIRRRLRYLTRDPRRLAGAARRELADFLVDQGVEVRPSATPAELHQLVREELGADGRRFAAALAEARFGPPETSAAAAARGAQGAAGSAASDPARSRPHRTAARLHRAPLAARVTPHAVVIAAGLGTRLRPLTERYAKPVLPIDGKPVIALLLRELAEAGFDAATVVTGHLAEQVERLVGDGSGFGARCSLRKTGLARRLRRRRARRGTPVAPYLVLGADKLFTRGDVGRFAAAFADSGAAGAIAVEERPGTVQIRDGFVERVLGDGPSSQRRSGRSGLHWPSTWRHVPASLPSSSR